MATEATTWEGQMSWAHDFVDATVAAIVARDARRGKVEQVLCGHTVASKKRRIIHLLPASARAPIPSARISARNPHKQRQKRDHGVNLVLAKPRLPRCHDCPFRDRRVVPGYGPDESDLVIVGQAPADKEALEGVPFVGQAGERLDQALIDAHLKRDTIYITNAVLCQPPDNQSPPPPHATAACRNR